MASGGLRAGRRPPTERGTLGGLLLATLAVLGASCAARPYRHAPIDAVPFRARAQTDEADGLRVTTAVPGEEEARALFAVDLYGRGIQPVWIEVANGSDQRVRFAPVGVERAYFSPLEVAYMHRRLFSKAGLRDMERHLHASAMPRAIPPGETRSGFVFTHLSPGTKAVTIDLFSGDDVDHSFAFFVRVPGRVPDHAVVDFAGLYQPDAIGRLDVDDFEAALDALGCCATDRSGARAGLPLNLALVGDGRDLLQALLRAGWYERTRAATPEELAQEQYWNGRPPDAVLRVRRFGADDRSELRLWLAPMLVDRRQVWLGQITSYIGRPTPLGRALFEPRLDPDVDDTRNYLLQLLWYGQGLERYAWQETGVAAPVSAPARDFRGVPWFGDGRRVVMWVSGQPVSQAETVNLRWDAAPGTSRP